MNIVIPQELFDLLMKAYNHYDGYGFEERDYDRVEELLDALRSDEKRFL